MLTISNWVAKRSGGRITVLGKDRDGNDRKIANVDRIEVASKGRIVATDKDGDSYDLAVPA